MVVIDDFIYTNNFSTSFTTLNGYIENSNKLQTLICLTNNVFLFGQEEIISVSTTTASTATSYLSLIFIFIIAFFQAFLTKKSL